MSEEDVYDKVYGVMCDIEVDKVMKRRGIKNRALIKCSECGREISDKALVCIHCGYPLAENIKANVEVEIQDGPSEKGYSLELLDYGTRKVQAAIAIKNVLNLDQADALSMVAKAPCYIFKGETEKVAIQVIKNLDALAVEYKMYLDGQLKIHKAKGDVTPKTSTFVKKIPCPNCNRLIPESVHRCPECDFAGIAAHLIQKERERQNIINAEQTRRVNLPKCPTCGSTVLRKVLGLSKATSVALWGIFSQKVKKQWHCNNCGHEW